MWLDWIDVFQMFFAVAVTGDALVFCKISQNLQEHTCHRVHFLN